MNVPIAQRTVGIDAQAAPNVSIKPITEAAFGADVARSNMNIAEAKGSVGKVIGDLGQKLFDHMAAKRDFDMEQESNDKATAALNEAHNAHDELVQKQGINAEGTYNNFTEQRLAIKTKYAKNLTAKQQEHYGRVFDNGAEVMGRSVSQNESKQIQVAQEDGIASRIKTGADIFAIDPTMAESKAALIKALSDADTLASMRGDIPATSEARKQSVRDTFAVTAAIKNPANVDTVMNSDNIKGMISQKALLQLQGIQVENLQKDISVAALIYKPNADGTPNFASMNEYAEPLIKNLLPEQQTQVKNFIMSQGRVKTAEIEQGREQNQKKFTNTALQMYYSGKSYDEIVDALVNKSNFDFTGYTNNDKEKQREYIGTIFTNINDAREKFLTHISPELKVALDKSEVMIKGYTKKNEYFSSGPLKDQKAETVYLNLVKDKVMKNPSITPDQLIEYTEGLSKDTTQHWWNTAVPKYATLGAQEQTSSILRGSGNPTDMIHVKIKNTGATGTIPRQDFNSMIMDDI